MSLSCHYTARSCFRQLRSAVTRPTVVSRSSAVAFFPQQQPVQQRRHESTETSVPVTPLDPKLEAMVSQISSLTLLEAADLASALKTRLNLPDMPVGGAFAAPAAAPAAAAPAEEEEAAPAAAEKTVFAVKLVSFDSGSKPKVIKEVKAMLGLSLVDSKKFVESAPKVMKESVPKDEAEKMKETLQALGAMVEIE